MTAGASARVAVLGGGSLNAFVAMAEEFENLDGPLFACAGGKSSGMSGS